MANRLDPEHWPINQEIWDSLDRALTAAVGRHRRRYIRSVNRITASPDRDVAYALAITMLTELAWNYSAQQPTPEQLRGLVADLEDGWCSFGGWPVEELERTLLAARPATPFAERIPTLPQLTHLIVAISLLLVQHEKTVPAYRVELEGLLPPIAESDG